VRARDAILRGLVFAAVAFAVAVAIDLLWLAVAEGGLERFRSRPFRTFRIALHGATFTMTAVGAAAGFALLRSHAIPFRRVAALGAAWGIVALAGVLAAVGMGGFRAAAIGLLAGSVMAAFAGGRLLGSRRIGDDER
jgi:hypothetical protein